jgi:hypothetical protein
MYVFCVLTATVVEHEICLALLHDVFICKYCIFMCVLLRCICRMVSCGSLISEFTFLRENHKGTEGTCKLCEFEILDNFEIQESYPESLKP